MNMSSGGIDWRDGAPTPTLPRHWAEGLIDVACEGVAQCHGRETRTAAKCDANELGSPLRFRAHVIPSHRRTWPGNGEGLGEGRHG